MKMKFAGRFITDEHDGVVIDFPDLKGFRLEFGHEVKAVDPETGRGRDLTKSEMADFEDALEDFHNTQMVKALKDKVTVNW